MKQKTVVIFGAGITGLVSAYYLSKNFKVIVLEKEDSIGGTAKSFAHKDFILDYGPHKLYTELPEIMNEISKVCPLLRIKKKNSIYLRGNYYDFPLKISQIAMRMPLTAIRSAIDALFKTKLPDNSYENYLINRFGKTMYDLSFRDYASKIWNSNPKELDEELAKRRVAVKGIFHLIKSILFKDTSKISAEYFYYPKYGIKQLLDSLQKSIVANGGKIILNAKISSIDFNNARVSKVVFNGVTIKTDYLISTIPLDSLSKLTNEKNISLNQIYQKLNIIYFILNRKRALRDNWIFFPEKKFIFQRVSEQKGFSSYTSPDTKTALMVETTKEVKDTLITKIIAQLESVGLLKKKEIQEMFIKTIEKAYPLYRKSFYKSVKEFINFMEGKENFYLLGRQGLFNYNNMDQCWDMAMKLAEHIRKGGDKEEWKEIKRYFDSYRIVD